MDFAQVARCDSHEDHKMSVRAPFGKAVWSVRCPVVCEDKFFVGLFVNQYCIVIFYFEVPLGSRFLLESRSGDRKSGWS